MIRIALVEDNMNEAETLSAYIHTYMENREYVLDHYSDGDEITDENRTYDLIFMDIEMKRMDGMKAARTIREHDEKVMIIFITKMAGLAIEGYSVDASDFIVKPVSYTGFQTRMDRAMRKLNLQSDSFLDVHNGSETMYVRIGDILYVETVGRKNRIHLNNGTGITTSDPLYRLEEKLSGHGFYRPHSAYLVCMYRITGVSSTELFIHDLHLPISKHRRKDFMCALTACKGNI